ncbi:MAG: uncharacterized protein A8A55_3623, partial [Amphiamblys sp. WSBS2006]
WSMEKVQRVRSLPQQFRWLASTRPDVRRGWKKVLQLRTGGLWAGLFAARIGIAKEELLARCPSCGEGTPETPRHMACDCKRWDEDRVIADIFTGVGTGQRIEWLGRVAEPAELLNSLGDDETEGRLVWL